ncbi:phage tail protein [Achromobacter xylosoxidans]
MATKTVYQSDPISGIYLFTTQANELALAPGLFNIPFGAYEESPPDVPAGEVAQWNPTLSAWIAVEDHRGETLYLVKDGTAYEMGSSVEIDGEPASYPGWGKVPAWLTLIPGSHVAGEAGTAGE